MAIRMKSKPLWFSCWSPGNEGIVGGLAYDNELIKTIPFFKIGKIGLNGLYYSLREVLSGLLKSDDVY